MRIYYNIQIVLKHNKSFFYKPKIQKQLMVALSHTWPLTIKLNKFKAHFSKRM
jgi:hypothetical protein